MLELSLLISRQYLSTSYITSSSFQSFDLRIGLLRPPTTHTTATQTTLHRHLLNLPAGDVPTGRKTHIAIQSWTSWVQWSETWPARCLRVLTPGLAPERIPSNAIVNIIAVMFIIMMVDKPPLIRSITWDMFPGSFGSTNLPSPQ